MLDRLLRADFLLFARKPNDAGQRTGDANLDFGLSCRNAATYQYECSY
jgi:hypothetical protein